jgi:beta-lactamase class A
MTAQVAPEDIPDWGPLAARLGEIPEPMRVSLAARHLASGSTLDHDADRPIQAASTIKTLILVALARAVDTGTIDLDREVTVDDDWRVGGSGVLNWLHGGVTLPLRDHAWLMIAISDNTASNAIIETLGVETIRQVAKERGVPSLHLGRRFYGHLPKGETNRNQVTAKGLTDLLTAIWNDTAASSEQCAWMRALHGDQQHRDRLARCLPEGATYAGKTGTLAGISHDSGVITGPSGSVAISVLVESTTSKYEDDAFLGTIGRAVAEMVS